VVHAATAVSGSGDRSFLDPERLPGPGWLSCVHPPFPFAGTIVRPVPNPFSKQGYSLGHSEHPSSSGISLYFLWSYVGRIDDLPAQIAAFGLTRGIWPVFILYFTLVNPPIEEYFWRGYLGSPTRRLYPSDLLYAGFHGLILMGKMQPGAVCYSLGVLVLAGWFWRQLGRVNEGLLAPVLGHMAADFTILMVVFWRV
jgi:hypothetical protein